MPNLAQPLLQPQLSRKNHYKSGKNGILETQFWLHTTCSVAIYKWLKKLYCTGFGVGISRATARHLSIVFSLVLFSFSILDTIQEYSRLNFYSISDELDNSKHFEPNLFFPPNGWFLANMATWLAPHHQIGNKCQCGI